MLHHSNRMQAPEDLSDAAFADRHLVLEKKEKHIKVSTAAAAAAAAAASEKDRSAGEEGSKPQACLPLPSVKPSKLFSTEQYPRRTFPLSESEKCKLKATSDLEDGNAVAMVRSVDGPASVMEAPPLKLVLKLKKPGA